MNDPLFQNRPTFSNIQGKFLEKLIQYFTCSFRKRKKTTPPPPTLQLSLWAPGRRVAFLLSSPRPRLFVNLHPTAVPCFVLRLFSSKSNSSSSNNGTSFLCLLTTCSLIGFAACSFCRCEIRKVLVYVCGFGTSWCRCKIN